MCKATLVATAGIYTAVLWASNLRADPEPAAIEKLIKQLGHDEFDKREEATRELEKIGEPALEALQKARTSPDAEVRDRATLLVRRIERSLRIEMLRFGAGGGYWLNRVAFSPDGKRAVATGGAVIWYDLETGREINRVMELSFARRGFCLSPDGKQFVTGHQQDRVVRLGDLDTGKEVRSFEVHTGGVDAVALSPDGKRLVTGGTDHTLRLWDATTGKALRRFDGINDDVLSAAFSRDGKRVASGHWHGTEFLVRLWDAESAKEVRQFRGHRGDVSAVLFTPGGGQLVSTGMDGAAVVWDVESGKEVRRMKHEGGIYGAALSPDGKRLLTAGFGDHTVRLWEVATGKELRRLEGHRGHVLGVAFSPDGKRALSSDANCTVILWKLPAP
jgi:tricorn protease-like protein